MPPPALQKPIIPPWGHGTSTSAHCGSTGVPRSAVTSGAPGFWPASNVACTQPPDVVPDEGVIVPSAGLCVKSTRVPSAASPGRANHLAGAIRSA